MSRRANSATAEKWRERLDQQERSGLSVAEFCRREGVSQPSFYQWRRRLGGGQGRSRGERGAAQKPLFVPVAWEPASADRSVQIELPSGALVRLPSGAPVELVAAAIVAAFGPPGQEVKSC